MRGPKTVEQRCRACGAMVTLHALGRSEWGGLCSCGRRITNRGIGHGERAEREAMRPAGSEA